MLVHKAGLFTLLLGAGLISAQSIPDSLSTNCSNTLENLLASPDAACMNLSPFLSLAIGTEKSVPVTINNWLTGLCSSGSCSNESLVAMVANVTTGCAQDLSALGVDASSLGTQLTSIVQQAYPTARKVVCLKDESTDKLCVTQTFENLENAIGSLGTGDLSLANILGDAQQLLSSNISSLACTDCAKAAMNIVTQDFPDIASKLVQPVENVCGASFTDGSSPDGITETAAAGQFSVKLDSGALNLSMANMAALLYIILACWFAHISIV